MSFSIVDLSHLLLWRSLTDFCWRDAATRPAADSVSLAWRPSSLSKATSSFSAHSRRLISIELLSWTNNQPPVWVKRPESFLAKLPSPTILNQSIWRELTSLDVLDVNFAGRKKIDTGDGAVANGHLTLACVHIYSSESIEVVKESSVRSAHGELNLRELGKDTEESHLGLCHGHLSEDACGSLGCEHFY